MACIYNLSHVLSPGYVWHATLLQIWFVSDTAKNLTKLPTRNDQITRHCCPTVALDTTACIYEYCFPIATSRHLAWRGFRIEMSNFLTTQPLKEDETWKLQQHSTAWIAECKVVAIVRTRHAMNHALLWQEWNLGNTSLETLASYRWICWLWIAQSTLANLQVFLLQVWCRTHTFHTRDPEAQPHLLLPPLLKLTFHQSTTEFETFEQCRWISRHLNFKQELRSDYSGER